MTISISDNTDRIITTTKTLSEFSTRYTIKEKAEHAIQNRKIFTITSSGYNTIRKTLRNMGWVEKLPPYRYESLQRLTQKTLIKNSEPDNRYEIVAISNLIKDCRAHFVWGPRNTTLPRHLDILRNRIKLRSGNLNFTTKVGLIACVENARKKQINGWADIQTPRVHRLAIHKERIDFLQDYRTTCCLILLKFITDTRPSTVFSRNGSIDDSMIDAALTRIKCELEFRETGYLKLTSNYILLNKQFNGLTKEWEIFYKNVNSLVKGICKIKLDNPATVNMYLVEAVNILDRAMKYWPRLTWDGYKNLWILKPAASCRGNGIVIKQNFNEIMKFAKERKRRRYIVQKYVERPLLIYNTKFDIRQYMLIKINESSFNIWMYKDCYLRFCSEQFQLNYFRASGHITNNSIQKKYRNGIRDRNLPVQNMWSLGEFKKYLKTIKLSYIWNDQIYPEMQNNIKTVILSAVDDIDLIPKSFQLFGCDFMLDENFKPILIEINASPDMSYSTKITANLCPIVLQDLIKVVLDPSDEPNKNIGNFEMIFSTDWYSNTKETNILKNKINNIVNKIDKKIEKKSDKKKIINNNINNYTNKDLVEKEQQEFLKLENLKLKKMEKRKQQIDNEIKILKNRADTISNFAALNHLSWRDIINNKDIKIHKSELNVLYHMYNKKLEDYI